MKRLRQNITFKSISGMVLLLVVFAGLVSFAGYRAFSEVLDVQYADGAFRIADAAAKLINADRIDSYRETGGDSDEYRQSWAQLDELCNASGATFIYVICPDLTDYGHISFLFSTVNHDSEYSPYEVGYVRTTTNDEYREKYAALYRGETERELLYLNSANYSKSTQHITAMVPLKGSDGQTAAILCVQRQIIALTEAHLRFIRSVAQVLVLLTVFVIVVMSIHLGRIVIEPLKTITGETTRFAAENCLPERKLAETVKNSDEIGVLADSIDRMEEQICLYTENLTRITAEREHIRAELSLASRIQEAMLPHKFPPFPERREFELFASMDPAKEVGGDFYDFFLVDEDHLCLIMADVSGKGVPAALFMMVCKIILQSCAMLGRSVSEILTKTNEAICSNNQANMFVTVWAGMLEISSGTMHAASAGHEYPVLRRADGSFALYKDRHGLPIGAMEGTVYREYELKLAPGDALFVYTDGVPEAIDRQERPFGIERMTAALNQNPGADPESLLRTVRRELDAFVGDAEQFDDITMLGFLYHGPGTGGPERRKGDEDESV